LAAVERATEQRERAQGGAVPPDGAALLLQMEGCRMMTNDNRVREQTRVRQQRFRQRHWRIDYVPCGDVQGIILSYRAAYPDRCIAEVIDRLILAGHQAMAGRFR